ncbi:MAG TPA: OmpH family outer membrane protein [Candidatus Babeliales bacterium]|jgi:Skp family chaperone for outer membrane proteins|nr:OmpH family outer membrane protein [Candidatus Babeliales bacterium]
MHIKYSVLVLFAACSTAGLIAEDKQVGTPSSATKVTPAAEKKSSELVSLTKNAGMAVEIWDAYSSMGTAGDGKEKQQEMEQLQKEATNTLEQQRQASAKRLDAFNAKKDTLSKEAREKEEQELIALSRDLQNEVQKAQERIRHELNKATEELARTAEQAAIEIAKEDNIDLLIEKNTGRVVYNKETYDITNRVTQRMDEKRATRLAQNKKTSNAVTVASPHVVGQKAADSKA